MIAKVWSRILDTACCCCRRRDPLQNPSESLPTVPPEPIVAPVLAPAPVRIKKVPDAPKVFEIPDEIWFSKSDYATGLMNMPDLVIDKVMENLSVKEVFSLRKVNHGIRDYLDYTNTRINVTSLQISVQKGVRCISYDFKDLVTFKKVKHEFSVATATISYFSTAVECGQKILLFDDVDFEDLFFWELEYVLQKTSSVLENLQIEWVHGKVDIGVKSIIDFFETQLKTRRKLLKVKTLRISAMDQSQVLQILKFLDSKFLEKLCIMNADRENHYQRFEIDQILGVDQTQNLRSLRIKNKVLGKDLVYLAKFPEVSVETSYMWPSDLKVLKNIFLTSPTFRSFDVRCDTSIAVPDRLIQLTILFGDWNFYRRRRYNIFRYSWYFLLTNDLKRLLELSYHPANGTFQFLKTEIVAIPFIDYRQPIVNMEHVRT